MKRGYDPEDERWFSEAAIDRLRLAQQECRWLLDRGYPFSSVIKLVGDHHQLSVRQRNALQRATASSSELERRLSTQLPLAAAVGRCLSIDGFNLVITLETALSGSVLILGADGVLRDLAGLRGTYRVIDQTEQALHLLGQTFRRLQVAGVCFYLDAPVSNSGRLRQTLFEQAGSWNLPVSVELVPNADALLEHSAYVVTGDSVILNQCGSWLNLAAEIVAADMKEAWIARLTG